MERAKRHQRHPWEEWFAEARGRQPVQLVQGRDFAIDPKDMQSQIYQRARAADLDATVRRRGRTLLLTVRRVDPWERLFDSQWHAFPDGVDPARFRKTLRQVARRRGRRVTIEPYAGPRGSWWRFVAWPAEHSNVLEPDAVV